METSSFNSAAVTERKKPRERAIWIDIIRAFAILNVLLIHASSPVLINFTNNRINWLVANAYDSFARFSVPLFVMISGLLLLDNSKNETIYQFFTKRLKKILIPFIFWGLVYLYWKHAMHQSPITPGIIVKSFISGEIYDHFWFIYAMIALYLLTPIYRVYVKSASQSDMIYFILVWIGCVAVLPLFTKLTHIYVNLYIMVSYIGFFILGYLLNQVELTPKVQRKGFFCMMTGFLVTFLGTWWLTSRGSQKFDPFLYDYASVNVIVMSVGAFILLKNLKKLNFKADSTMRRWIINIGEASFGIYFVHMIVQETLQKGIMGFRLSCFSFHPLLSIPATCLLTFIISLMIVLVIKKIPLMKNVV